VRGNFGQLMHECGKRRAAREAYVESLALLKRGASRLTEAAFHAAFAALQAADGHLAEAERELAEAAALDKAGSARALYELHRGHLDLARGRASMAQGDVTSARRSRLNAEERLAAAPRAGDEDIRFAKRLLAAALRAPENAMKPPDDVLVIEEEGRWFHAPGGVRVVLGRRAKLKSLLLALTQERQGSPGRTAPPDELIERAWPGEHMRRSAATNRLRVAIAGLRDLGLRSAIVFADGGYRIDENVRVVVVPAAGPQF